MNIRKSAKTLLMHCGIGVAVLVGTFFFVAETRPLAAQVEDESDGDGSDDLLGGKRHGKGRVSIRLRDDSWGDVRIESAALEGRDIRIRRRANIFGLKGSLDTNLEPGSYTLRWTVTKPAARGNRITLSFQKTFTVRRGRTITVTVTGQKATVY
jgi:hypothetical protein